MAIVCFSHLELHWIPKILELTRVSGIYTYQVQRFRYKDEYLTSSTLQPLTVDRFPANLDLSENTSVRHGYAGDGVVSLTLENWPLFGQKFSTLGQIIVIFRFK